MAFARVPPDTCSYFEAAASALEEVVLRANGNAEDDEDAPTPDMLLANVLAEAKGKAVSVCVDPQTSRAVESMMKHANAQMAGALVAAVVAESEHAGGDVACNACGSRALEAALNAVARADPAAVDNDTIRAIDGLVDTICARVGDVLRNVPGSYCLRALVRTVGAPAAAAPEAAAAQQHSQTQPRHPGTLSRIADAVADLPLTFRRSVVASAHGSAAFQTIVLAHAGAVPDGAQTIAARLLGAGAGAGLAHADIRRWACDKCASRFVECAVRALAPSQADALLCPEGAFHGHLGAMARHASGNFVVQACLSASSSAEAASAAADELVPIAGELMFGKASAEVNSVGARVMRALVDCCGRASTKRREAIRAVVEAAASPAHPSGETASDASADAAAAVRKLLSLLPHDRVPDRIQPASCALLTSLLCYPPNIANRVMTALSALPETTFVGLAKDSAGSALLECVLDPARTPPSAGLPEARQPLPKALYKAVSEALAVHAASLAMTPAGSRVLEALFATAKLQQQEELVATVARARAGISKAAHGRHLLRRLGAETYARSPIAWRKARTAREMMAAALDAVDAPPDATGGGEDIAEDEETRRKQKKKRKLV